MAGLLALGGVTFAAAGAIKDVPNVQAADTTYTFTMDKDHLIASDAVKVGSTDYSISISNSKYTAGTTNFGTILNGGYLVSDTPLYGIKSITAYLASGSMRANFSYKGITWDRSICINPANFPAGVSSSVAIEGAPDYFYLEFTSDTVVNSISISYTCNAIAEPVLDSTDILDLAHEAEGLSKAEDLSVGVGSAYTNGSPRSLHLFQKTAITSGDDKWPTVLLSLKTPFAMTTAGHFTVDCYGISGNPWVSMTFYDSSWAHIGGEKGNPGYTELGFDFSNGAWSSATSGSPTTAGTVALIRLSVHESNTGTLTNFYLDNLKWVA
jgi:hypothetical protein